MSELKCCPFCGGEAREYKQRFLFYKKAVDMACCDKCGFSLVKSVWNTRKPMANIVEKLEEAEKKGSELIRKTHMDSHVLSGWGCAMKTAIEIVREEGAKNDRS